MSSGQINTAKDLWHAPVSRGKEGEERTEPVGESCNENVSKKGYTTVSGDKKSLMAPMAMKTEQKCKGKESDLFVF